MGYPGTHEQTRQLLWESKLLLNVFSHPVASRGTGKLDEAEDSPLNPSQPTSPVSNVNARVLTLGAIVLLALAVHGPLLLMQLPASSYDANTHMFFASNYAQHWFNPWNDKWYGGFSQTTYPPLAHQWIALF